MVDASGDELYVVFVEDFSGNRARVKWAAQTSNAVIDDGDALIAIATEKRPRSATRALEEDVSENVEAAIITSPPGFAGRRLECGDRDDNPPELSSEGDSA